MGLGLPLDEDTVFDRMSIDDRTPPSLLTLDPGTRKHSEFDLASNNAVQQSFWDLQPPADCHNARFLILSEYHHSGIGSTLHIRALQFMLGMYTPIALSWTTRGSSGITHQRRRSIVHQPDLIATSFLCPIAQFQWTSGKKPTESTPLTMFTEPRDGFSLMIWKYFLTLW